MYSRYSVLPFGWGPPVITPWMYAIASSLVMSAVMGGPVRCGPCDSAPIAYSRVTAGYQLLEVSASLNAKRVVRFGSLEATIVTSFIAARTRPASVGIGGKLRCVAGWKPP